MKNLLLSFFFFTLLIFSAFADNNPSGRKLSSAKKYEWMQYGFSLGVNLTSNQTLVADRPAKDKMSHFFSGEFNGFFRAGKYIFAEIGVGYIFNKALFQTSEMKLDAPLEKVEMRYMHFPVKAVGYIPITKVFALQPYIGIIYQPLINISRNFINFNRDNITNHQLLLTAGLGAKIHFVTVEFAYKHSCLPFYANRSSTKIDYLTALIGFQF